MIKFNFKKMNRLIKGFTIVETLVAIAILMIAIAGPLTIAHKGLLAALYAHDQVTASYLAQDAMEYLKNVKNNNYSRGNWLQFFDTCETANTLCKVDTINGDPSNVLNSGISNCTYNIADPDASTCKLYMTSNGYVPDSSGPVIFSRYFYIVPTEDNETNQAKLYVVVKWKNGTINNEVTYQTEIFNTIL